jgi:pimeloyl-ACP methyl ester carboxylesterase
VTEFGRALEGEASLLPYVEKDLAEMVANVAEDPSKLLDGVELSAADRAVLQREDLAQVIREATEDLARGGPWGWVDDDLVFVRPWGFDISEIRVPVEVRYGLTDVLVPAAHGEWLAAHVPNATVVAEADEGHMGDIDKVVEMTRWLVTGDY